MSRLFARKIYITDVVNFLIVGKDIYILITLGKGELNLIIYIIYMSNDVYVYVTPVLKIISICWNIFKKAIFRELSVLL